MSMLGRITVEFVLPAVGSPFLFSMINPYSFYPPPAIQSLSISPTPSPHTPHPPNIPFSLCTNPLKTHSPLLSKSTLKLNKLIKPNKKKLAKSHNIHKKSINLDYGNRTLNIASINPDSLRTKEAKNTLINTINALRIDIACMQETHNERIDSEQIENYTIFYGGCDCVKLSKKINTHDNEPIEESIIGPNSYKAGVAIVLRNDLTHLIKNIFRISSRIMELRIQTGKKVANISILNTYAPRNNYPNTQIYDYWALVNSHIPNIPHKLIRIWCTDNNGQVSQNNHNDKYIGPWRMENNSTNINGDNLAESCINNNYICVNTFFIPKNKIKPIFLHGLGLVRKPLNKLTTS